MPAEPFLQFATIMQPSNERKAAFFGPLFLQADLRRELLIHSLFE